MTRRKGLQKGLTAVITGASSGIGRALAIMLAIRYSARLVINARSKDLLEQTGQAVINAGGQAECVAGDIADASLARLAVETCVERYGGIDLLVNNAGLARPGAISQLTPEDWHHVFAVNFFAALYATYAALPHMVKKHTGKIVNISSVAGKVSFPGSVCYSSSKFALTGMSLGMAAELKSLGIDVLVVSPGWVRSEFFEKNAVADFKNPKLIAKRGDFKGWIMRNWLSISPEQAASEIIKACRKDLTGEIVLTGPGVLVERLHGVFPRLVQRLSRNIPPQR